MPFLKAHAGRPIQRPLVLGNPTTNEQDRPALDKAEHEARAIAELYNVTPLIGAEATIPALQNQASQAGIIHIAAHGQFDPHRPLESTIYLSPTEKDEGRLTVSRVYELKLDHTELVVLSACETLTNELVDHNVMSAGDDVIGLTRAFFFAGTPSVVATLWSVNDNSTRLLIENFYSHMRAGMGKAEALRQAQLDVRNYRDANGEQIYASPFYWSGFVLTGDGGHIANSTPWIEIILGIVLLIVMLGMTGILLVLHRRVSVHR
jgi:CHAT domain-containing protein